MTNNLAEVIRIKIEIDLHLVIRIRLFPALIPRIITNDIIIPMCQ